MQQVQCPPGYIWLANPAGCYSTTPVTPNTSLAVAWIEYILHLLVSPIGIALWVVLGVSLLIWYFRGDSIKAWWKGGPPKSSGVVTIDPYSMDTFVGKLGYFIINRQLPPPAGDAAVDDDPSSADYPNGGGGRGRAPPLRTGNLRTNPPQ